MSMDRTMAVKILREHGQFSLREIHDLLAVREDLRDKFAIAALPTVIARCSNDEMGSMAHAEYFAMRAYELADAMLEARK